MTGTTTQIMIDLADLLRSAAADARSTILARLQRMLATVAIFAVGCAAAAVFFAFADGWCFILPPTIALMALARHLGAPESDAR
jgi:uncharacterized membrane protein YoaK (UPF0700 family)